ncbi:MAG: type II toxin-antitoxin system RelB/DinJ family antitoxin [Paraburkholderia sp.]|nr:MAG: type II toxin-antitoxin system RelB/DinJ family antitoxin [Paraburkholderia sp.]
MLSSAIKTTDVRARIEPELKEDATRVLAENGLTISDAVRLFLRQVVMTRGLPFDVRVPNETTLRALRESDELSGRTRHRSTKELFDELEQKG